MSETPPDRTDVVVYGATPAGIAAACCAAEEGASVLLLEPSRFVGGHLTSGICTTESEHMLPVSFSGWMERFLRRLGRHYGLDGPLHRFEPHVAEASYLAMLDEAGVRLRTGAVLDRVATGSGTVRAAVLDDGTRVEARVFVDASYEGDLMAGAGVPYRVGREAIREHDESLAGIRFVDSLDEVRNSKGHAERIDEVWEIDLRRAEGDGLIDGVSPAGEIRLGEGDGKVMNYHFRVTVSKGKDRIPFPRPDGYREERFALLARWLAASPARELREILDVYPFPSGSYRIRADGKTEVLPGDKAELNNSQSSICSLGHLGGQFGYPEGTREERAAIVRDHYDYNAGMLYFLAESTEVPAQVREAMREWGLPPDEYPDHGHWPYQPYIRETRRMQGAYLMRQHDVLEERDKDDAIMWNSHWIDCHHVERLALDDGHFRNEGRIWREVVEPYAVPYRALTPEGGDCSNLLVPGCVSATHVAFCSIRLESTWMGLGEAAGVAAARAVAADRAVQEIDVAALQERLRARGVNL